MHSLYTFCIYFHRLPCAVLLSISFSSFPQKLRTKYIKHHTHTQTSVIFVDTLKLSACCQFCCCFFFVYHFLETWRVVYVYDTVADNRDITRKLERSNRCKWDRKGPINFHSSLIFTMYVSVHFYVKWGSYLDERSD